MSIVKRVIEDHHGRIRIESQEGQGASFMFTIPRNIDRKGKRIGEILVDDGLITREQLDNELKKQAKDEG